MLTNRDIAIIAAVDEHTKGDNVTTVGEGEAERRPPNSQNFLPPRPQSWGLWPQQAEEKETIPSYNVVPWTEEQSRKINSQLQVFTDVDY